MKNTFKRAAFTIIVTALIWSCSKDDGPKPLANQAPVIYDQSFHVPDLLTDVDVIGLVEAFDSNMGTELSYSIALDNNDMFEINETTGSLSLKAGKQLDLDAPEFRKITVKVTDGEKEDTGAITICDCIPVFAQDSYEFEVPESITPDELIHTFEIEDADTDIEGLTFKIPTEGNTLFKINKDGELSLAPGKNLDFETNQEHDISVSVEDNIDTVEVAVKIKVLNEADSLAENPDSFVTTWQTDVDGETIYIGLNPVYNYDFTIDWGDGSVEDINLSNPVYISHVYENSGNHTVAIAGDFPAIRVASIELNGDNVNPAPKPGYGLVGINQWGAIQWKSMGYAFGDAATLEFYEATDTPDLSQVNMNMTQMFKGAVLFNADLNDWDVSNVANMSGMFQGTTAFNGDLSDWEVDKVINMYEMFSGATSFNANISNWKVGKVIHMGAMFKDAMVFDQDLGNWNIGSITDMTNMFDGSGMSTTSANATLIGWADFVGQNGGPVNITCGMEGITVCGSDVDTAGQFLANDNGWQFPGITNELECP